VGLNQLGDAPPGAARDHPYRSGAQRDAAEARGFDRLAGRRRAALPRPNGREVERPVQHSRNRAGRERSRLAWPGAAIHLAHGRLRGASLLIGGRYQQARAGACGCRGGQIAQTPVTTVCPPHDQAARLWIMVTRGSTRSLGSCRERRVKVVLKRGSEQGEQEIAEGPGSDGSSRRWRVAAPGCHAAGHLGCGTRPGPCYVMT
jgi:hypothetical protein